MTVSARPSAVPHTSPNALRAPRTGSVRALLRRLMQAGEMTFAAAGLAEGGDVEGAAELAGRASRLKA